MSDAHPPMCDLHDHAEPGPLSEARIAAIAKALAHPARIRILEQFIECDPQIAQEIVDESDLAQSTISEHLRLLREADLLTGTRDGPRTWYCMRRAVLRELRPRFLISPTPRQCPTPGSETQDFAVRLIAVRPGTSARGRRVRAYEHALDHSVNSPNLGR